MPQALPAVPAATAPAAATEVKAGVQHVNTLGWAAASVCNDSVSTHFASTAHATCWLHEGMGLLPCQQIHNFHRPHSNELLT